MRAHIDVVVDEGVVHVVSDGGDGAQVQRAAAKDSPGSEAVREEGGDIQSLEGELRLLRLGSRHLQDGHAQGRTMALVLCDETRQGWRLESALGWIGCAGEWASVA